MQAYNDLFVTDGTVRYAFENGTWFIKLVGAICHPLGPTLNSLVDRAISEKNSTNFVIDLTEAKTIDSTCLGILTRIATRTTSKNSRKPIIITNNGNITKTILIVRFDRLFELVDAVTGMPIKHLQTAPVQVLDKDSMLNLLLDAHRRLCAIDAQTHDAFINVVTVLEAEMQRNTSM